MRRERERYLDMVKGVSILMVVFCHYAILRGDSAWGTVLMSVTWAAVPCFFMVTGGIMHQAQQMDWGKHLKRIGKVYLGLSVWKAVYLLIFSMIEEISFSKVELVRYLFMFGYLDGVSTGVMWFMNAYLVVLIIFPVSRFLFQGNKNGRQMLLFWLAVLFVEGIGLYAVDFLLSLISAWTGLNQLSVLSLDTAMPMGNYANMIFYFILGGFFYQYRGEISSWLNEKGWRRFLSLALMLLGTAGLMLIRYFDEGTFLWRGIYLEDGYNRLCTVAVALGVYLLCLQGKDARFNQVFCYLGQRTMGIYYLHYLILVVFWSFSSELLSPYYGVPANLAKTVVVTALSLGLTNLFRRIPGVRLLVS